ncbi:MFS transporter [Ureibacillus chungkukjangi]|uniref:Multidrug resistance protein n=1 Tax=Ureibacillus chungkukjangi TaxID=1202712 RepID=A0A318U5R6_9BACL|nr:MFS transporter [Ureibacillus chungkukjangi]MCM3390073.1 MFS transporter [Ureibacillus chungkukjangi]PYF07259.1 multidrug resistance protein [Ureibacillus chungkukjangi]
MNDDNLKTVNYPLITFILTFAGLTILMSMYITIPLTATWISEFSINETKAIWLSSAFSLCYAFSSLIYGPLSDRFGRKVFLVYGITFLTIITILCGFVENYELLLILRILQAMGASAFVPISLVYIADVLPAEKRLKALGFVSSSFLIASVVAQVFSTLVQETFGWHYIFLLLGLFYIVTSILTIVYLPKDTRVKHENSILTNFINIKNLFINRSLCISFLISFMLLFSLIGMYTILGTYLAAKPLYFTDEQILIVRATGLIAVTTSLFANNITRKFGVVQSVKCSLLVASLSLFLMAISPNPILSILFSLFFIACIALLVPVNISLINKNSAAQRGTAILFNAFILFIGASFGPMLASQLMLHTNSLVSFVIFGFVLLLGYVGAFFFD